MEKNWGDTPSATLINAICIDRGEDFRPVNRDVLNLRSLLVEMPVLTLTATCDERFQDIVIRGNIIHCHRT